MRLERRQQGSDPCTRTDHYLNCAPPSGKSSIVDVIQDTFDGVWMNLGVDRFMQMTPARYLPGMGLDLAADARTSRHSFRSFIARFMSPSPTAAWD